MKVVADRADKADGAGHASARAAAETGHDQGAAGAVATDVGAASPAAARRFTPRGLLRLQRSAGNAAVVQRLAGTHPSPPPAPTPADPHADPRFAKVTQQVGGTAKGLRAHPPAAGEAKKASAAASAPPGDKLTQANAAQADKMSGAKPGTFDKAAFVAAVKAAIAAKAPQNLEEADNFAESGKADGVRSDVMGHVTKGKEASAKDVADKTNEAPDTSKSTREAGHAPDPGSRAEAGHPRGRRGHAGAGTARADRPGGRQVRDRRADGRGGRHRGAARPVERAGVHGRPGGQEGGRGALRHRARPRCGQARRPRCRARPAGPTQSAAAMVGQMTGAKADATSDVGGQKEAAKTEDDPGPDPHQRQDRRGLRPPPRPTSTKILTDLDTAVGAKFDEGEKVAKAAFTADHKGRMERYKDQRYSGLDGAARWVKDKFAGMPAEANQLFLESQKLYESKMEVVISDVADLIGRELGRAKDRIAQGRQEITTYVANEPKELQKIVGEASDEDRREVRRARVGGRRQAGASLVDDLADALRRGPQRRRRGDQGAPGREQGPVGQGQGRRRRGHRDHPQAEGRCCMGVLARAAGAIEKIIKDPIGFLGNLINAVKAGVMGFAANIVDHLKTGLQGWLFGALGSAGIEIPETLDLKGIIKLVLSILGLTWTRIRTKIVKRIGEAAMEAVEKGVDIFQTLVTEGVGGLWKFLLDKLSDLKDTVMSAIQDFVVVKIVKAGITWLISALNPAAAFIKACKMIYDVVMFFVEKGSQIKEFVDSVLDSIESIVGGGVGAVAKHIENTLAKILPLLLGFLASLLGLGGISEKIKEILEKVQKPVEAAVDFVINGALKLARPIINLAKRGAAWVKGKYEQGKAWVKGKYEKGKEWAKDKARAVGEALGIVKRPVDVAGESHTLSVDTGTGAIRMASVDEPLSAKVARWVKTAKSRGVPDAEQRGAAALATASAVSARIRAAKEGKSELAQQQLDALGAAISDLVVKLGAGEVEKRSDRPDGLGNIAPHGSQGSSNRGDVPERHLESEHVIPVSWVSLLFERLAGMVKIRRGSREDNRLHTVMIYKTAASGKTVGAEGADNLLVNQLKALVRTGMPADVRGGSRRARRLQDKLSPAELDEMRANQQANAEAIKQGLLQKLPAVMAARVQQTAKAIRADHTDAKKEIRGHDEPLPDESRVRAAASAEAQDVAGIFIERVEVD